VLKLLLSIPVPMRLSRCGRMNESHSGADDASPVGGTDDVRRAIGVHPGRRQPEAVRIASEWRS